MRAVFPWSASFLFGVMACGSQGPIVPGARPAVVAVAPAKEPRPAQSPPSLSGPPRDPRALFPPSPITDFANSMRQIALAALDGGPLPEVGVPIERQRDPNRLVRAEQPRPAARDLEVFAFAMEITLILRAPNADGGSDEDDGGFEVIAFLSRTGLKVAGLRPRGPRAIKETPGWLSGARTFGNDVLGALRRRRIGDLLVGDTERPVLNDDFLFKRLMDERPKVDALERLEALAAKHERALGYHFDDVYLLARDRSGSLVGLQLQVDEDDGQLMLDAAPLVRVERLRKDRDEPAALEAPKPPPPP